MNLKLIRRWFSDKATVGELYVNDEWECFPLEDRWRGSEPKVAGSTCIPEGTYKVVIDMSARFKRMMPRLLRVPGFEGIRIHSGNTDHDTEGCILVGMFKREDFVGDSRTAFALIFSLINSALRVGQEVTIEILDGRKEQV
jgi:hypothetical protein